MLTRVVLLFFLTCICSSAFAEVCVDTDGDGWGWSGTSSCLMESDEQPFSQGECVDPDGDGWGWDGNASCLVSESGNQGALVSEALSQFASILQNFFSDFSIAGSTDPTENSDNTDMPENGFEPSMDNQVDESETDSTLEFEPLSALNISSTHKPINLGCNLPQVPPGGIWTADGFVEYDRGLGVQTSDGYVSFDRGYPIGYRESEYERQLPRIPFAQMPFGVSLSNICATFSVEGGLVANHAYLTRQKLINKGTDIAPERLAEVISGRLNYWSFLREQASLEGVSKTQLRELRDLSLWLARDMLGPDFQRAPINATVEVFNILRRGPFDSKVKYRNYSIGLGVDDTPFTRLWDASPESLKLRYLNVPVDLWPASKPFVEAARAANAKLVEMNQDAQTVKLIFNVGASFAVGSIFREAWVHYFSDSLLSTFAMNAFSPSFNEFVFTGRISGDFKDMFLDGVLPSEAFYTSLGIPGIQYLSGLERTRLVVGIALIQAGVAELSGKDPLEAFLSATLVNGNHLIGNYPPEIYELRWQSMDLMRAYGAKSHVIREVATLSDMPNSTSSSVMLGLNDFSQTLW